MHSLGKIDVQDNIICTPWEYYMHSLGKIDVQDNIICTPWEKNINFQRDVMDHKLLSWSFTRLS